jgi:hypothetical protein
MMASAQLGTLGFPLVAPRVVPTILDYRLEPRFVCKGKVRLDLKGGAVGLKGELIDVSAHGFRVSFAHPAPATGTEMEFSHQFFEGRAQVMWTLQAEGHFEAGCKVLRD